MTVVAVVAVVAVDDKRVCVHIYYFLNHWVVQQSEVEVVMVGHMRRKPVVEHVAAVMKLEEKEEEYMKLLEHNCWRRPSWLEVVAWAVLILKAAR